MLNKHVTVALPPLWQARAVLQEHHAPAPVTFLPIFDNIIAMPRVDFLNDLIPAKRIAVFF